MKGKVLISLALCSVMLSGCDFFRGLAGRPLSSEIEAKREKIELALREKEQRRLDSLARISRSRFSGCGQQTWGTLRCYT